MLADNTRKLITKKQTKPRPVASAAPRKIGKFMKQKSPNQSKTNEISMKNIGVKAIITNRMGREGGG